MVMVRTYMMVYSSLKLLFINILYNDYASLHGHKQYNRKSNGMCIKVCLAIASCAKYNKKNKKCKSQPKSSGYLQLVYMNFTAEDGVHHCIHTVTCTYMLIREVNARI